MLLATLYYSSAIAGHEAELSYTVPASAAMTGASLPVFYEDARPEKEGGAQPRKIGTLRSDLGFPIDYNAKAGSTPADVIPRLAQDCLHASGRRAEVAPARTSVPTDGPWAEIILTTFYLNGFGAYRVTGTAELRLHDASAGDRIVPLHVEVRASALAPAKGFTAVLNALMAQCVDGLSA